MAINGNYYGIYINGQRIALTKSNDLNLKRAFDDITTKDSDGSKEVFPTAIEANASMEGVFTSSLKNKLQWPENFANAVWSKGAATVSGTKVEAPNGQLLGQVVTWSSGTFISQSITDGTFVIGNTITFSVYLKGSGTINIQAGDDDNISTSSTITLTSNWTRYTVSHTLMSALDVIVQINKVTGTSVTLAYPQLELGTVATSYKGSQETFADLQTLSQNRTKVQLLHTTNIDDDMAISMEGFINDLSLKSKNDAAVTFTCNFESTGVISQTII